MSTIFTILKIFPKIEKSFTILKIFSKVKKFSVRRKPLDRRDTLRYVEVKHLSMRSCITVRERTMETIRKATRNEKPQQECRATHYNHAASTRRNPKIASMRNGDDCICNHRRCDSKRYFRVAPKNSVSVEKSALKRALLCFQSFDLHYLEMNRWSRSAENRLSKSVLFCTKPLTIP